MQAWRTPSGPAAYPPARRRWPSLTAMLLAHELLGPAGAPELVLVHGITDSHEMWRPLLAPLAEAHRVLAVDLRGHGASPDGDAYDPLSYAADVVETVRSVEFTDPLLVGHSLGGVVVSAYAAIAPCRGVVNIDQPLRLAGFKDGLAQLEPMLRADDATFQAAITMMFTAMNGPLPATEQARLDANKRADQQVVLGTWASVFESTAEELDAQVQAIGGAVDVPYLAIHGLDPGPGYAEWLTALIPSATYEEWPDLGHYLHLVHPARFLARLAAFEASLPGGQSA